MCSGFTTVWYFPEFHWFASSCLFSSILERSLLLDLPRFSSSIFGGRGRGSPNFDAENNFLYLFLFLQSTKKYLYMISFSFFNLSIHMRSCRKNFAFRQVVKKSWWWERNPAPFPISDIIIVKCTSQVRSTADVSSEIIKVDQTCFWAAFTYSFSKGGFSVEGCSKEISV